MENTLKELINNKGNLKIIGVTGSFGKTSTIKILSDYLRKIGKRCVVYSSLGIDAFGCEEDDEVEIAIYNLKSVINAFKKAYEIKADFLILEVNEKTLDKGYLKDIPFDIRAITNLYPRHNTLEYTEDEYINLKQSFFKNINEDSICIYGDLNKQLLEEFLYLNNNDKKIISTNYLSNAYGLDKEIIDYLVMPKESFDSLSGLNFLIQTKKEVYELNTSLIMPFNALNIAMAFSIVDTLDLLDIKLLNEVLQDIIIKGRCEVVKEKERIVIISVMCMPHLEILKKYRERGEIKSLKILTGSYGAGFDTWDEIYKSDKYKKYINGSMILAYNYIIKNCDFVYITTSDNAASDIDELINTQVEEVKGKISFKAISDRKDAIRAIIKESNVGDCIFINGRGNRKVFCKSKDKIDYYSDIEIVKETIKEIKE